MTQVSQLSPELGRSVLQLARALLAAVRNWTLYPPDHPTVAASVARLVDAIAQSSHGAVFSIGITPETLLIEGAAADATQSGVSEAATMLHDCDLLRMTFVGDVTRPAVESLLRMLTLDLAERRRRGGPAQIWENEGDASIALEQIDYKKILARDEAEIPESAKRDDIWRSIVMAIADGRKAVLDEAEQQRLLTIAASTGDIADLATAAMAPKCARDGSPMITSQAAAVLATFRHLTGVVAMMAPKELPEVIGNLASAAAQLDPHVLIQMMQGEEDPEGGVSIVQGLATAFDDVKVAQLLATALALDGQASDRLATIFNTIAPDEDRKRRVLTLTRTLLSESDFGRARQFQTLWTSIEELLVSYNDKPFVSESYRAALDGVGGRAERVSVLDMPPELPEWMDSLGPENIRTLSVRMLVDLLAIERDAARAAEIAADLEVLGTDLLIAGAYGDAHAVTSALAERARSDGGLGRDACRLALDRLGESVAMRETVALLGEVDESVWDQIRAIVRTVGVSTIEAIKPIVTVEHETVASRRAEAAITAFGPPAVLRLVSIVSDPRWFVQRAGARMLRVIGSADAVMLLQPLLRKTDLRVAREAVAALASIDDPAAARAIYTVLRASTGALRRAVVDALVADRDPRVVPMLVRIVDESQPLGADHDVVLETLAALGAVGSDEGVPPLVRTIRRRGFFGRRKLRALKQKGVEALVQIGTQQATDALKEAATSGDRLLRKVIAAHLQA